MASRVQAQQVFDPLSREVATVWSSQVAGQILSEMACAHRSPAQAHAVLGLGYIRAW